MIPHNRQPVIMLLLALAGLLPQSLPAGEVWPDVRVLRSDTRTLTFEFRPECREESRIASDGRILRSWTFDEGILTATEGAPDLRQRIIPVALPAASGTTLRVINADYEEIHGVEYSPVPATEEREGMPVASEYRTDGVQYRGETFDSHPVVELLTPGRSRSVLIGRIGLRPILYDAASRTVRKYSRIVVEISFGAVSGTPASTDDPLLRGAVVNGEALAAWRAPAGARKVAAGTPSVLATGTWYRIAVTDDGIYKLDAAYLTAAGISIGSVDPRTVKIYGNGGREVPEGVTLPRISDLAENAIYVEGESDGVFNQGDHILFFGRSVRGVQYDSVGRTMRHYLHHYTETNTYWLTFGGAAGKRMEVEPSVGGTPDVSAETFTDILAFEEEKVNLLRSGRHWFGQAVSGAGGSFTSMHQLPGLVPDGSILYRYAIAVHTDVTAVVTIRESGTVIATHQVFSTSGYQYASLRQYEARGTSTLANPQSQFSVTVGGTSSSQGWIDWLEIHYPRRLWAVENALRFRSIDTTGTVEYRLQQFTSLPMVLDVTAHAGVRRVTGVSGSYLFRVAETQRSVKEYYAATSAAWKTPASITRAQNQDLHGAPEGAEFIIITPDLFRAAADRLKAHREQAAYGGVKTAVVDLQSIYNEFGGGLADVSAIRDFLFYAYSNWTPSPRFVLFLGNGTYDFKGILGSQSTFVPTWQTVESGEEIQSFCTDDFFVKFGLADAVSMVPGRICARSAAEADLVVDKTIRYDSQSDRDPWKMRMLFIGDDAFTSELGEVGDRFLHSDDQERLSLLTPDEIEKEKIYIAEYPTVYTAVGRRKPAANQAIVDQVNRGALMVNYSGHGRADLLAHERIFEVHTEIPQLTNANRLAVWMLATCGFSQFDDPAAPTGSEYLMNKADGAGVAVVSATRKVYQGANAALNEGTYRRIFVRDAQARLTPERPATALFQYKATTGDADANDQKFVFMGDPTLQLQYPRSFARIDSVNGEAVDSVGGNPRVVPIAVRSMSHVSVAGSITGSGSGLDTSFSGRATLVVNDATQRRTIVNFYPGNNWTYTATGGTIFRGDNTIRSGRFASTFVVPKDIAYADSTSRGRLVAYVSSGNRDGVAYTGKIRVTGADSTAEDDGRGPVIDLYLNSRNYRPGDLVGENATLVVDLRDSNGINSSGSGIGHRIEAWLNGALQSRDLTEYYRSVLDDYRSGTLEYPLTSLPLGRNSIRLRAWDSFNNSGTAETYFTVASGDALTLAEVFNYPNPFAGETYFVFRQNQSVPLNVTVKVFTVAGRLIRTLDWITNGEPYVRVPWDGRDQDGDQLANGVYLFKVIARTVDGRYSSEAIGKCAVVK